MSSEVVLKVYNLLVHYGEGNERNFRHLMEDGFFDLVDGGLIKNTRGKHIYIDNISYLKCGEDIYMTGKFFKEAKVSVEHQRGKENKAVVDPVVKDIYPDAVFFLDLVKHRVYWFYPKDETFPPQAYDLASYVKKKMYAPIKKEYEEMFKKEFREGKNGIQKKYSEYKKRRELECNITRKRFTVSAVPLIDNEEIKKIILDDDYIIKSIGVKAHLKNSTKEDGKKIREWSDPFDEVVKKAKGELGASFQGEFRALSNGVIEKKENVVAMVEQLSKGKNFDLSVKMVKKGDSKKKKTVHSNPEDGNHSDIGLKKFVLSSLESIKDLIRDIINVNNEIEESFSDDEIQEASGFIEDAVAIGEIELEDIDVNEG